MSIPEPDIPSDHAREVLLVAPGKLQDGLEHERIHGGGEFVAVVEILNPVIVH